MAKGRALRALEHLLRPRTAVACALVTSALCATRSLLFLRVPQFHRYRLYGDWSAPRWQTLWVYALLFVVAIWCVHALGRLFCDPLLKRGLRAYLGLGSAVTQVLLLLGLFAYLWLVVRPPGQSFVVTEKDTIVLGEVYRALRVETGDRAAVPPKPTVAWLQRRLGNVTNEMRLERGRFWKSADARSVLVVARAESNAEGAFLRHGEHHVLLQTQKERRHDGLFFLFRGLHSDPQNHRAPVPNADVRIGSQEKSLPIDPEWAGENAVLGLKESPVVLLRAHRYLATPLALIALASLLMAAMSSLVFRRGTRHPS